MEDPIQQSIMKYVGSGDTILKTAKLYGDASYRLYFRVILGSGRTLIVMKMPKGRASASEEITNYEGPKNDLPYINISNHMRALKLPVPEIYYYDKEGEVIILEDLGDHLFFRDVVDAGDDVKLARYREAIDLLVRIREKVTRCMGCMAFKRSFDDTLLNWEFDHFLEYGVEARLGRNLDDSVKRRFRGITRSITGEILKMDYIFTHRDYQSRNLIVRNSKLYVIDFQDALLGPAPYDLVALTRDSYVEISDRLLEWLISYYVGLTGLDIDNFRRDFDLVTIQRKLKDAGRFVYIDRVKGNPDYLKNIPRSLDYVKKAVFRRGEYAGLMELLKPYVPEWG